MHVAMYVHSYMHVKSYHDQAFRLACYKTTHIITIYVFACIHAYIAKSKHANQLTQFLYYAVVNYAWSVSCQSHQSADKYGHGHVSFY